jgi:pyruvate/2-oxoglutarate dehydrogenase complex dihydrolipoamide acyltransferase (E2) component
VIPIRVSPGLWHTTMLPQGVLVRWLRPDGALVESGEALACVEIEESVHEITSPGDGWLTLDCALNAIVEPGTIIAHLGRKAAP